MPNTVLIGAQWGDEGKGKVIDVLSADQHCIWHHFSFTGLSQNSSSNVHRNGRTHLLDNSLQHLFT